MSRRVRIDIPWRIIIHQPGPRHEAWHWLGSGFLGKLPLPPSDDNKQQQNTQNICASLDIIIMSEGGIYPWKVQRIELPRSGGRAGVVTSYANLKEPLPSPPKGQTWVQDVQTREWKVVPVAVEQDDSSPPAVVARPADANYDGDDATAVVAAPVSVEAIPVIVEATDSSGGLEGGVRYHDVLPTDTFQGICLRYKVTPTELRRANKMIAMAASSTSLKLAPKKLIIPANDRNKELFLGGGSSSNTTKCPTREEKIATLIYKVSRITQNKLTYSEAVAYLELAEGDVTLAIENVYTDFGWTNGQSSMEEILLREEQITALIANVSRRKITVVNNNNNSKSNNNNRSSSRLSYSEARAYLELADWDVNAALTSIREDLG